MNYSIKSVAFYMQKKINVLELKKKFFKQMLIQMIKK